MFDIFYIDINKSLVMYGHNQAIHYQAFIIIVIITTTIIIIIVIIIITIIKGLNFAIPPKKLKFENYLLPLEILFQDVCDNSNRLSDDDCLLDLKCKIKDVGLSSFKWYNKKIIVSKK